MLTAIYNFRDKKLKWIPDIGKGSSRVVLETTLYISSNGLGWPCLAFLSYPYSTSLIASVHTCCYWKLPAAIGFLMYSIILSARLIDIWTYSFTVFHDILLSLMKLWILFSVTRLPLSDTIVFCGPKHKLIYSFKNFKTSSVVSYLLARTIGQPVRCSTATGTHSSLAAPKGNDPAISIENILESRQTKSHRCPIFWNFLTLSAIMTAENVFVHIWDYTRPPTSFRQELSSILKIPVTDAIVEHL